MSQVSSKYGESHLDHLGVPRPVRPALPIIKLSAVAALYLAGKHPRARSVIAAALVSYYSAATTFHVLAKDTPGQAMPAAAMAACAAALV